MHTSGAPKKTKTKPKPTDKIVVNIVILYCVWLHYIIYLLYIRGSADEHVVGGP